MKIHKIEDIKLIEEFKKSFKDAGSGIMQFAKKSRGHAILVGLLFLIAPINLIMGLLVTYALYKGGRKKRKAKKALYASKKRSKR